MLRNEVLAVSGSLMIDIGSRLLAADANILSR
jgi:hypothetical protein